VVIYCRVRFLRRLVDPRDSGSFANRLRERRFERFRALVARIPGPIRILDVGGTPGFWQLRGRELPGPPSVVCLNLEEQVSDDPTISTVVGDAVHMPQFEDQSFDVVFSNAVIEHVETLENQARMASEIRRVGQRYFVMTPNRGFPLEPHFLFPGFQFLPMCARVALLRRMNLGWYAREPDPIQAEKRVRLIRLMSEREFRQVFPDATIHRERLLGLTKSFTAYQGF